MRWLGAVLLAALAAGSAPHRSPGGDPPENFVFFNRDRERISEASFLETKAIAGAQIKYTWRALEPRRDSYDIRPVVEDLSFLEAHGKSLWIQIQDVSFDERKNVPDYLLSGEFGGGVARKYERTGPNGTDLEFDGWVARRWDPAVIARFGRLLEALGKELDGRIEGLNLPETAIGFDGGPPHLPEGFTFEAYAEGVKKMMTAAREAFRQSRVIAYANFMPGEALPGNDRGYLRGIYEHAERIGVGVGGPDFLPHRKGQQAHGLKLLAERRPDVVAGLAVQWGNLADRDPATGRKVTAEELYRYARDPLRLDYIFWGTQEPYYSGEVLPLLRSLTEPAPPGTLRQPGPPRDTD